MTLCTGNHAQQPMSVSLSYLICKHTLQDSRWVTKAHVPASTQKCTCWTNSPYFLILGFCQSAKYFHCIQDSQDNSHTTESLCKPPFGTILLQLEILIFHDSFLYAGVLILEVKDVSTHPTLLLEKMFPFWFMNYFLHGRNIRRSDTTLENVPLFWQRNCNPTHQLGTFTIL